ncbi:MAG: D-alanyl-D-alanine dipeptidase [Oscillatoriales cyanobacterium]|nr:MAG: D-alanyl-D-alanine dipeptidase [Oscillatoriales cyanobacterium]
MPIPSDRFCLWNPPPYAALGAPYGDRSPFHLRSGVLERLEQSADWLDRTRSGWRIAIFDAYRPIAVQQFMVDYTFGELARAAGLDPAALLAHPDHPQTQILQGRVTQFWAAPSHDPATPPPHSTGAALDVTLVDLLGEVVDMGSPIDECSERSFPDYFNQATDTGDRLFGERRQLLRQAMAVGEFAQHPNEWWHFSWGDQLWAERTGQSIAHYGGL